MPLCLTTTLAGRPLSWPLDGASLTLGRSSRNSVQLPDGTVSKEHAEIVLEAGAWRVRDLGSRNGTRVNGAEARGPTPLREGDVIEVGSVVLRVAAREESPARLSPGSDITSSVRLRAQDFLGRPGTARAAPDLVHLLAEAGRVLVLPRPLKETCEEILAFVERAIPASRLVVLLREAPGAEPVQMAARYRGGGAREPLQLSRSILATVLDECTAVVISDARQDPRYRGQLSIVAQAIHSALAVPLFDNQRVLGLLYADTMDPSAAYGQEQLEIMTLLGNMAAVKITNARLLEAEQARLRMAHELATAARIQRGLLPAAPPAVEGWGIEGHLETCHEVGGDLYDVYLRPDGSLLVLAGDVTGKGMGAALLMSSFLASARVLYDTCPEPGALATRLGALVARSAEPGRFVTGFAGLLDPRTGELRYVNAGHPPPCLVRDGALRRLESTGVPFGVLEGVVYEPALARIEPGEMLALYSDGIPEARHGAEFFDDARLERALLEAAELPDLAEARGHVMARVAEFVAGAPRSDDLTLLLLRRARAAAAGPPAAASPDAAPPDPRAA